MPIGTATENKSVPKAALSTNSSRVLNIRHLRLDNVYEKERGGSMKLLIIERET